MSKKTMIRVVKNEDPYVKIDKTALKDERLSWKAKGILCYLLSLPDDWQIYINELQKHSSDGRDSTASALKELIKYGYCHREQSRDERGRLDGFLYTVFERPQNILDTPQTVGEGEEEPETGFPFTDNPKTENPQLLINNNTNKLNILNNTVVDADVLKVTYIENPKTDKTAAASTAKNQNDIDPEFAKIIQTYNANVRPITPIEAEKLAYWYDLTSSELVIEAITEAVTSGIRTSKYIDGILRTWHGNGISNLEQLEAHRRDYQDKKQNQTSKAKQTGNSNTFNTTSKPNKFHNFNGRYGDMSDEQIIEQVKNRRSVWGD